ncbi:uncharacterized protein LOC131146296 [Malania oleifera]|uniref:uncharacterized protein LOC131146296 n=1 Tax=Malania oleifera TaxID=397392 RepID=UPI0025ADF79F|nr:uncharacterized protein LOC131146296 [Malania oleifera]XP_057951771.1 uncharacterized protein LOC131146296 [Malania oleifera]XP_057951772.1 uncharacterized protein LOC131146296 [Malania oleifera]XP_057951773.1 uncharacterized protein LOC131146296 [Malania oleifera]XP_057951775.1 uncharacterized protein LOC131146296 [Malania oleifera]
MTGNMEPNPEVEQGNECSFEWDEASQLYFHASTGFYHDPSAGWYYSSRDGLYYKFENGNYVLLESYKGDESEMNQSKQTFPDKDNEDESFMHECSHKDGSEAYQSVGTTSKEPTVGLMECISSHGNENPTPPSEWLEETLINLYLSGYSNPEIGAVDNVRIPLEIENDANLLDDGNDDTCELEEGEWIPEDAHGAIETSESDIDEDVQAWRAQYGQVSQPQEESMSTFPVVDLWDWTVVTETKKHRKFEVVRLVGRLMRWSTKLHPSLPSSCGLYKTAPICEVYLDLVRVTSGQVYKLRSPSAKYIASLSIYDSSNPTKDWGFPELSIHKQVLPQYNSIRNCKLGTPEKVPVDEDFSILLDQVSSSEKHINGAYRDRAAERRALHGGFGEGPGQKKLAVDGSASPPLSVRTEEAGAEALNMSFGAGSYARKILENMGWKEGEALGKTSKGLLEPLQAVGNKGNAGLGWGQGLTKYQ